ncbi:MAG: glutamine-hydrolyzing GMP synthase, partial [Armatimonadota bacterium]
MSSAADSRELVIVVDFGAQYAQLIARRIRECRVYSELVRFDEPAAKVLAMKPKGIVLSGGPASVYGEGAPRWAPELYEAGVPVLGICYGMQVMSKQLGGEVVRGDTREYGRMELTVECDQDLFHGLDERLTAWMSHGDVVTQPPGGFRVTARTPTAIAAMSDRERKLFGVQFHPEVIHTPFGMDVFRNFLYRQCGCHGLWTPESIVEESCRAIQEQAPTPGLGGDLAHPLGAVGGK